MYVDWICWIVDPDPTLFVPDPDRNADYGGSGSVNLFTFQIREAAKKVLFFSGPAT